MYSMILMMAMSGSAAEAPAWPLRRNDCTDCASCASSWGTSYASGAQHIACYGYSLNCVGFGCFGSYPTYFAGPVTPYYLIPAIPPKHREGLPAPKPTGRDGLTRLAPAELTVTVPADAQLYVDGQRTRQTSSERRFETPPLPQGQEFQYSLRMDMVRNGKTVSEGRQIIVRAGAKVWVKFTGRASNGSRTAQK